MKPSVINFNPVKLPDSYYADPYPFYAALREQDPVHKCPDGSYFLTKYSDLHMVYRDPKTFLSNKQKQFKSLLGNCPLYEHHTTSLVFNDPPLHTHVRKAIGNALSSKTVNLLEPQVESIVDSLLQTIEKKSEFDLVNDYAIILPLEIIRKLMRVPEDEKVPLQKWSLAILSALEQDISAEEIINGNIAVTEFVDFLEDLVERRRNSLTDDDDDMLARLIRWESEGFKLSTAQIYHQCIFILNAGHETTANLIANGLVALLQHPEQLEKIRASPGLINNSIEELLRYESPVQLGNRITAINTEINGVRIPADTTLTLSIGSANRDPEKFDDPDQLDITRMPIPHFSFAHGIHTCAGNNIGRLEARIAILRMIQRFPNLALNGPLIRQRRARFRAFENVRMTIS